ncbi:phosphonate ABC transporter, permease protein PhnE [Rhizobium alvei]|nr:phosphonate ABC transporter, permease protein PhnE [Rhizobium alvei]
MNGKITTMNGYDMDLIAARHPALVQQSWTSRLRIPIVIATICAYFLFSFWFFAFGKVFQGANWDIAGAYLADWVSYEERPEIRLRADGTMTVTFPNNSALGANPHPDWLEKDERTITRTVESNAADTVAKPKSTISFMAQPAEAKPAADPTSAPKTVTETIVDRTIVTFSPGTSIEATPELAIIRHQGDVLEIPLGHDLPVRAKGQLPAWASQPHIDKKIILSFGLTGWAEIDSDRIKIRNRFFGWANFFFDTNSVFFGKSLSDVASLMVSGERLDPKMSNFERAANDILYNPSWQHLDVWTKLLQTIVMAFVGTLFAMVLSFPLAFIAARNITANSLANQLTKRLFDFLRSVDMLIWALFFTRAFGPGPLAGISAIFFTDTGTLGKLYSEALENIDNKPREGVKSVGASPLAVQRYGVIPQVLPIFASQALYFWESNTRSATIIGAVGAGGIGLKLWEAMRTNSDWENVAYMVVLILLVVYLFDTASNALRSRLIGGASR